MYPSAHYGQGKRRMMSKDSPVAATPYIPADRSVAETTVLGAAYLAGLATGYWHDHDHVAENWALDRRFTPAEDAQATDARYGRWKEAVRRAMHWEE